MGTLRRHQLAYLSPAAWARLGREQTDSDARDCIAHWASHGLPAVVTRQPAPPASPDEGVCLGLSAPAVWRRRRLGFRVPRHEILWFDEFPTAERIGPVLPRAARAPWTGLCTALAATGAVARVYGSHGWQWLSGLRHVRTGSDVDLWVAVDDEAQADVVAARLEHAPRGLPRLDGELMFGDGSAVSWREWLAWRRGSSRAVLVRTLDHGSLRWAPAWREAA